jgi:tRNA threonylcarbamoyladenosine biosynthesis protein TsaE
MKQLEYRLTDEAATVNIGESLAKVLQWQIEQKQAQQSLVVFLNGDLGAGKTTLTRGFVRGMGHQGNVKSPTYTLVEPYELPPWQVYHFDLYRLADPEELEYMGIRDYFSDNCCCFIEWPEKGTGLLANADIIINMVYQDEHRGIDLRANSIRGDSVLQQLERISK